MAEPNLFQASPFAEEYPLSKEHVVAQQDGASWIWSSDMDHQLSLFVRKYCFDFSKASKALRSYVQHVLVEMDEMEIDSQAFTEDACRKRWSLLDMTEFERRQGIARELMTMREVVETRASKPSTPQTGTRFFGDAVATSASAASSPSGRASDSVSAANSTPNRASPGTVVPDEPRVGSSLAPTAERMPAPPHSSALKVHGSSSEEKEDQFYTPESTPIKATAAATRGASSSAHAVESRDHFRPPTATKVVARDATCAPVSTMQSQPALAHERKEAWGASPLAPYQLPSSKAKVTSDSDGGDSDDSEEVQVVDAGELRRSSGVLSPKAASAAKAAAAAGVSAKALGTAVARQGPVLSKEEFEKNVHAEQLERSDFSIFTHDLKKTCDGYYDAVKANLPSIQVEEVTDDDDDDVAPVFSNLRVNDKGEYIGTLRVGPLLADLDPSAGAGAGEVEHACRAELDPRGAAVASTSKPSAVTPAAAAELTKETTKSLSTEPASPGTARSPAAAPTTEVAAVAQCRVPAADAGASRRRVERNVLGHDSASDQSEEEEVVDAAALRRRALGGGVVMGNGSAAAHTEAAAALQQLQLLQRPGSSNPIAIVAPSVQMDESSDDSSSSDDEVEEVVDAAALRRQAMGGGGGGKGQEPVIKKGFLTANKANISKENTQADAAPALHANKLTEREREEKIDEFQARVQQNVALKVEIEAAKGLKLLSDGQYANAVEHLSSAIEEAGVMGAKAGRSGSVNTQTVHVDDTVKWLLARGKCYLEMGECYNAIPDLGKAVSLDGASVEARLQYAIALRFACQYVEASEQIKQLLRLDPGHAYGKLEQRRLEQRLAHAQGRDLDTWRRKDSVITTAKDIQARAEKSIQESRNRVEQAGQRDKEKEFEEAFFKQIAEAKQRQEEEREQLASRAGALLDVGLNGIDVDELLRELKALKPDENFLKHVSTRATPNGSGSDAGQHGGGGGGGGDGAHEPRPSLPRTGPPPDLSEEEAKQLEDLFQQVKASENAAVEALPPPTDLEVRAGARALKSNISDLLAEVAEEPPVFAAPTSHSSPARQGGAGAAPRALPPAFIAPPCPPGCEEASAPPLPISKGSIGAKLRALREGGVVTGGEGGQAAAPVQESSVPQQPHHSAAASSSQTSAAAPQARPPAALLPSAVHVDVAESGAKEAAAPVRAKADTGADTSRRNRGDLMNAEPTRVPKKGTKGLRKEAAKAQGGGRGRMQMAGSDDDDDDSEEEDLMAIRSKLKEQSKKVSPEEQEAEDRRKQAQMFLELRAQQDREEQEGRRQQELQRKLAEEARQKQLDELAAESAKRRREMDREREEREKLEREELKQRQAKADEEAAALADAPAPASRAAVDEKSNVAANSATLRTPAGTSAAAAECEIETAGGNENNETQRLLEERVQSGALRHKKMLELSKGPMPALPSALFFELSQREALTHLPEAVEHHCVLVLPDMAPALLAGVLHWIITPSSLQTSLEAAAPSECEAYGLTADDQEAEQAPASAPRAGKNNSNTSLPVFPFQVVGVMRGCLSTGHCMPSLLPASTQTRGSCGGAAEPVVMIALAPPQNARMPVAGAAGVPDLARSVKELLATVRLEDVYLGDKSCMPVHDTYLNLAISASLEAATSVISGKCAVSSTIKSPLLWFVCAPAAAADDSNGGDAANAASSASSARISSDDTVVSVLRPEAVRNGALGPILVRLAQANMDVVALRMLFPSTEHYVRSRSFTTSVVPGGCPVIVLGTRGYKAIERWSELVGPEDPMLAKRTDPASLRAKYGMDRKRNLLTCSRSSQRNRRESEWYFSLAQDVELDKGTSTAALPQLPMMVAYRVATSTMALRAGLPGSFVAQVVSFCLRNGFGLAAFRRSVIEPSANQHVGLPAWVNIKHVRPPPVCLQWTGENAVSRLLRLAPALEKLAEDAGVPASFEEACTLTSPPRQLSHRANPTKAFESVGNVMAVARNLEAAQRCGLHLGLDAGPECIDVVRFSSRLADMPARFVATQGAPEAVCVVVTQDAVSDASAMSDIFEALLINTGAELLGAKLLHWLPDHVAAEACPYAKDHYLRADCLEHLESGQAFVIAMRMVDGLERMRKIVGPLPGTGALALSRMSRSAPGSPHDTETLRSKFAVDGVRCAVLMPNDAKHAVRLMSCVFEDDELSWPTNPLGPMALVPPPASENVIEALKAEAGGPPPLRTVALVKAEARQNFGKILKYVRRGEFKIVALKVISPTQEERKVLFGTPTVQACEAACSSSSTTSSPSSPAKSASLASPASPSHRAHAIALLLERHNAVATWLNVCGHVDPQQAKRENEFSLRAIFGVSASANGLHASNSYGAAVAEAEMIFSEIQNGKPMTQGDKICGARRRQLVLAGTDGAKSLKEPVLVVLCQRVLEEEEHYHIIDSLMREDFRIINIRMTWLSTKQATELAGAIGHRAVEDEGRKGPCLILAMERDSGVSRLQMTMQSRGSSGLGSTLSKFSKELFYSESMSKSFSAVAYCFDFLCDSTYKIESL